MFAKLAQRIQSLIEKVAADKRLRLRVKLCTTVIVLVAVGITFGRALARLDSTKLDWRPEWLVLSGVVYLAALGFSMAFWWWSMVALGQQPDPLALVRSYYIGHLGKYVPGKAMVMIMRAAMVRGPRCRPGIAALTVAYETQAFMAAGGLILAVCLAIGMTIADMLLWQALLIIGIAGVLTLPPVFNRIVAVLVAPFRGSDAAPLPQVGYRFLFVGLFWSTFTWFGLGLSLIATVHGVLDLDPSWGWGRLPIITSKLAAATIVGFIVPLTPGGLGMREWMLLLLFQGELGREPAALVALVLRLVWIAAEVVLAGLLTPLPWRRRTAPAAPEEAAAVK